MTDTVNVASRLALRRPAVRRARPGRLLLAGPSGAGKTWTALTIARQLVGPAGRIVVVDTERESAELYTDQFPPFDVLPWAAPYDPRDLAVAITAIAAETDALIVDSGSHFWTKAGGTLDIVDGKYGGWKVGTPAQEDMVDAILDAPCHIVFCVRSKMAHTQELDAGTNKWVVRKLGMAPVQRDDLEYEFTASADLDMEHRLSIGKSRCADIAGRTYAPGHAADMGATFAAWLASAEPVASRAVVDDLVARMNAVADQGERTDCKARFVERFGRPEFLLASSVADADAFVTGATFDSNFDSNPSPAVEPSPNPQGDVEAVVEAPTPAPAPPVPSPPPPPAPRSTRTSRLEGVVVSGKVASKLHADMADLAKELGHTKPGSRAGATVADTAWCEGTLGALVLSATNTRTDKAGELTMPEKATMDRYMAELGAGTMTSNVADNGNVTMVIGGQSYRFVRTPDDGLIHVGAVAS